MNPSREPTRPRVVHLTSVHVPTDNRILYKECTSLAEQGYAVSLIAPHAHNFEHSGVSVRAVPVPSSRALRLLLTNAQVLRTGLSMDASIYHAHDPELLPILQVLRLMGKTVIFDMHENLPAAIKTKHWIKPKLRPLLAKLVSFMERVLLYKIPVIFAEDSYLKQYSWVKTKTIIRNMPRIDRLPGPVPEKYKRFTIGYIGRVGEHRGSINTVMALDHLRKRNREIGFACVGIVGEEHRKTLDNLVKALALDNHVRLFGYLPLGQGLRIISRCHLGMATLLDTPNYTESYPTKLFEYMALGIPALVSDFPLYRNVVESAGCGLWVDPGDPRAIADAIEWFYTNPDEAHRMGQRGQHAVRNRYRWKSEAENLVEFYKSLLRLDKSENS